jgi:hypothetical protein
MKKKDEYIELRIPSVIFRTIPVWMVVLLVINSSMLVGFTEYYVMKKHFNASRLELSQKTKSSEELVQTLKQQVIPQKGLTLGIVWNDIGKQLLDSGVIDKEKYTKLFVDDIQTGTDMKYLTHSSGDHMIIADRNSRFMVNTLWALGLVNKSTILNAGSMQTRSKGNPMNFASTGGWNLGSRPTSELYASQELVLLTPEQEALVNKIAGTIYRPCCDNSTEFPDCNHGMAALGYVELAVRQGLSEKKIYKDILALNSFWFPQTYVEQAAYFQKLGKEWNKLDPKLALSSQYSSAQGSQIVRQSLQDIPGLQSQGGGCSA